MKTIADIEPDWMMRARREIGVKEVPGGRDHPRIVEYLAATLITPKMHHDETPWCAAFVCWVLEQSGVPSTRSAAARRYLKWGQELDTPRVGCIAVLSRYTEGNPGSGHVGFYAGSAGDDVLLLGGNQANQVCMRLYSYNRVLSYRWPESA